MMGWNLLRFPVNVLNVFPLPYHPFNDTKWNLSVESFIQDGENFICIHVEIEDIEILSKEEM